MNHNEGENINDNAVNNGNRVNSDINTSGLWVFGYGSLCWQPGFDYHRSLTGCVHGYARKFWQGNTTHRGTIKKPGRVATLVEEKESVVWGRAYEVRGEAALPYLNTRECRLGGYLTQFTTFYPYRNKDSETSIIQPFPVLLYIATPNNDQWLGEAPLHEIATQIADSKGASGHNVEYLIRLASFMRDTIPEAIDEHLFTLEYLVRSRIKELNISLDTLMGDSVVLQRRSSQDEHQLQDQAAANALPRPDTFQFTAHVPEKTLRCLNI